MRQQGEELVVQPLSGSSVKSEVDNLGEFLV
jgi:hypothetical protein